MKLEFHFNIADTSIESERMMDCSFVSLCGKEIVNKNRAGDNTQPLGIPELLLRYTKLNEWFEKIFKRNFPVCHFLR